MVVVVAAVFAGVLPAMADFSRVWDVILAMSLAEVLVLLGLGAFNLFTTWLLDATALPGLGLRRAATAAQSSATLANVLPAGAALGVGVSFAMFQSWGFTAAAATRTVLVTGLYNNLVKLLLPVTALLALTLEGTPGPGLASAAVIGVLSVVASVALLMLVLRSDALARRVGEGMAAALSWLRRLVRLAPVRGWGDAAVRFRHGTAELLRTRWHLLTIASLFSHLAPFVVLLASMRVVGVDDVTIAEALGAFAVIRVVSAVPVTPGGLGVVEAGLSGTLIVAGAVSDEAVAAVLVYRILTYLLPIPVGAVTYIAWLRRPRVSGDQELVTVD